MVARLVPCLAGLALLFAPPAEEGSIDALSYFRNQYPRAFQELLRLYGNGTYLLHVHWPRRSTDGRMRILLRWPVIRYDMLDPSDRTSPVSATIQGPDRFISVRRSRQRGSFVLRQRTRVLPGQAEEDIFTMATNQGFLPLLPLGFFGVMFEDYFFHDRNVELKAASWEDLGGCRAVRVEAVEDFGDHGRRSFYFWFAPDLGWVPLRWERGAWLVEMSYEEQVNGIGIIKTAKAVLRLENEQPTVWQAEMLSYELERPPEREFTLAAFGIPEPSKVRARSRLWLWTLIGALGTLTVLFLLRLSRTGRREKQGSA